MKRWLLLNGHKYYELDEPVGPKGHKVVDVEVRIVIKKIRGVHHLLCGDNVRFFSEADLSSCDRFETYQEVLWELAYRGGVTAVIGPDEDDDVSGLV